MNLCALQANDVWTNSSCATFQCVPDTDGVYPPSASVVVLSNACAAGQSCVQGTCVSSTTTTTTAAPNSTSVTQCVHAACKITYKRVHSDSWQPRPIGIRHSCIRVNYVATQPD
jgi:hypothetical protein